MVILALDGTRYFRIPMVAELLAQRYDVTIAISGNAEDSYW